MTLRQLRKQAVLDCYYTTLKVMTAKNPKVLIHDVIEAASKKPAPRIYTTADVATRNVSLLYRGKSATAFQEKRAMYNYIKREVDKYLGSKPLKKIVAEIIQRPAPSFFISPEQFRKIVYNQMKIQ